MVQIIIIWYVPWQVTQWHIYTPCFDRRSEPSKAGQAGGASCHSEWDGGPCGAGLPLHPGAGGAGRDRAQVVSKLQHCPHLPVDPSLASTGEKSRVD